MAAAPQHALDTGSEARRVFALPVETRVLRGCAYCGAHLMTEAEFLAWLERPRAVICPRCRSFTRAPADVWAPQAEGQP